MSIQSLFDLSGKSALVTGATGALGAAAAKALAAAGAHVTIAGGNGEALRALHSELESMGAGVRSVQLRPSDEKSCDTIVSHAVEAGDGLDILVSASGSAIVKPIVDMEDEDYDRVMDANVKQSWMLCRSVGRGFASQGDRGCSDINLISPLKICNTCWNKRIWHVKSSHRYANTVPCDRMGRYECAG